MTDSGSMPNKKGRVKHVWGLTLAIVSVSVSLFLLILYTDNSSFAAQQNSLVSGITYSQSSSQGVSSQDESPVMPENFYRKEQASVKQLKKMKLALKKSLAEDAKIDVKIKSLR